jgi:hypothetical protein
MAYSVTITYVAPVAPAAGPVGAGIGALWNPESYVDGSGMDGTVYDTNKPGFGSTVVPEPYASTSFPLPSPLAQFKVATATAAHINTFDVDTFAEAEYYVETGKELASQGFTVTVVEGGSI